MLSKYVEMLTNELKYSIPENIIDEVRDRTDIVEVVSKFVSIKKVGKNFKGLCPFHSEKTPSFTVSSEKRIYHCFGCGAGGNVFKFVMEVQNISFVDAVQQFAESAGVPIPIPNKGNLNGPKYQEREALKKANELATNYFQSLFKESEKGLAARDYLKGRHFDGEILDQYKNRLGDPRMAGTNQSLKKNQQPIQKDSSSIGPRHRKRGRV